MWRLNRLLNNQWINKEIKEEMKEKKKTNLKTNENRNTMSQNLWDTAKAVPREKIIAIQVYLNKQEKS